MTGTNLRVTLVLYGAMMRNDYLNMSTVPTTWWLHTEKNFHPVHTQNLANCKEVDADCLTGHMAPIHPVLWQFLYPFLKQVFRSSKKYQNNWNKIIIHKSSLKSTVLNSVYQVYIRCSMVLVTTFRKLVTELCFKRLPGSLGALHLWYCDDGSVQAQGGGPSGRSTCR